MVKKPCGIEEHCVYTNGQVCIVGIQVVGNTHHDLNISWLLIRRQCYFKRDVIEFIVLVASYGIFLQKLFRPTVRKNCSSDREKLLKLEAEGREFAKVLRSLEQFIQTVKCLKNFW